MSRPIRVVLIAVAVALAGLIAAEKAIFPVLDTLALTGKQKEGFYLVPTNQLLRPWGEQTLLTGRPVDMAFDSSKRLLAVLNWRGVVLLDGSTGTKIADVSNRATSYAGIAFRPGDRELWASEVTRNGPDAILVADLSENGTPSKVERIAPPAHPVPVGIAFSADGSSAYVAFSRNNTLAVIDAGTRQIRQEVPVGMAPHGVVVSPKQGRIFVSNRGGRRPRAKDTLAPTSGAQLASDPRTGSTVSGTVSVVDARTLEVREVVTGLAPSGLALSPDEQALAVANGHSDSVTLIDTEKLTATEVKIPTWPEGTLGSQPVAAAFSSDGETLYVACGGNNAVAVVRRESGRWKVEGAVPSGWFPSGIAIGRDETIWTLNVKGVGSTANQRGSFISTAYEGSLNRVPAPLPAQVAAGTREVAAANQPRFTPAGGVENLPSLGIQHVFFIIKENRTYDQVFGDFPQGNGDPNLLMYGRNITPNHHALAEQFVLLDNFYTTSAISFDGHHWLMQAFVSDYVQRAFGASPRGYAWDMSDALTVSPAGFFWQGARRPVDVRIYGEFCLPARWDPVKQSAVDIDSRQLGTWTEYWKLYKEGQWQNAVGCSARGLPALAPLMSARYPQNDTIIPDQIRAEEFLRELAEREKSGKMANINIITLTADHTNGTRPGSPTPRAMVADNDLALGRMIEGISKSRFWPRSLILVVEDDAQDGLDHVDGHRTVALATGPHIRRGVVDSHNYNQLSMVRTIQEIFGIEARTRALKSARAMHSLFTAKPDAAPYRSLPVSVALDEMNPPLKSLKGRQLWAAQQSAAMNWEDVDDVPSDILNRILWWDSKGYDKAYPQLARGPRR